MWNRGQCFCTKTCASSVSHGEKRRETCHLQLFCAGILGLDLGLRDYSYSLMSLLLLDDKIDMASSQTLGWLGLVVRSFLHNGTRGPRSLTGKGVRRSWEPNRMGQLRSGTRDFGRWHYLFSCRAAHCLNGLGIGGYSQDQVVEPMIHLVILLKKLSLIS
jgi:hypothetical protein